MPGSSFRFIVENASQIVLDMSQVGTQTTNSETTRVAKANRIMDSFWPDTRKQDQAIISNNNNNMDTDDAEVFEWPNCFEVYIDEKFVSLSTEEYHSFCTTSWKAGDGVSNLITITPIDLDETISHTVQVFKSSEAQFNSIVIEANYVTLNQINIYNNNDDSVPPSFSLPNAPTRRIEFVGDSITAGYCNLCEETSEGNVFAESQYESWTNRVANQLNAEFHTIAWSGYGMVNNCCGGTTTMPMVYPRTLATVEDALWDFSSWIPDVVVINLGTNDFYSGSYNEAIYVTTYGELLNNMTLYYGDQVSFFLACGPMAKGYCSGVEEVIDNYNNNPLNAPIAYFLDQTSLDVKMNCCGHPTAADDQVMANYTASFIASTIGW